MRSLGSVRFSACRAVQLAGAATVAVLALAGCSAGQTAETSLLETPVSGLDTASPDGALQIRDLQVLYNSVEGYPANGSAPLEVSLFNQTESPITVTISSQPQQTVTEGIVSAQQIGLTGPAGSGSSDQASPSPAPGASAAALAPAKLTIDALGSVTFLPGQQTSLIASGLSDRLAPGASLALTIQVGDAAPMNVLAPVAIPLSPASRGPGDPNENVDEG